MRPRPYFSFFFFTSPTFVNLSPVRGVTINFPNIFILPLLPLKHEIKTYPHLSAHALHLHQKTNKTENKEINIGL